MDGGFEGSSEVGTWKGRRRRVDEGSKARRGRGRRRRFEHTRGLNAH